MPLTNTSTRFGTISRFLHWSVALLVLYQYVGANVMTRLGREGRLFGMNGDFFYDWHKSIGLVLLALVIIRLLWRKLVALPEWHGSFNDTDKRISHRLETWLYWLLLLLPVTGYLFVMAGGYGVRLFGLYDLPNPIGKQPSWSWVVWSLHILFAYLALVVMAWHVGTLLRHRAAGNGDVLHRMLPFR